MRIRSSIRYAFLIFCAAAGLSAQAYAQSAFDDPGSRTQGAAGGDFKPVADKVDGASVTLGGSAQVVVLFRNDSGRPVNAGAINLYPSSNISASVGENQCSLAPIESGEICAISVSIKGLQQGNYRIEMLMRHDGRSKLLTATINGRVETSGTETSTLSSDIETIPPEIDFGSMTESRSQVKSIILRNVTSKPIEITDIAVNAGSQSGFTMDSNCGTLETGAACVASVTWMPEQRGPSTGIVVVKHNGPTSIATVELTGTYDPGDAEPAQVFPQAVPGKGLLVSSQEEILFGDNIAQSSSITVSLVNVGDVPLTLTNLRMSNSENGIKIEKSGCREGSVLAPIEACPLTLTWEPVREGAIVDDVQISHTGARGVLVIPMRGSALRAINKDSKAIMLGGDDAFLHNMQPLTVDDLGEDPTAGLAEGERILQGSETASMPAPASQNAMPQFDVRGVLDGYTITSYSAKRAIVSGPGGSRVVFDGEQTVIGGVLWVITMRPSAVEFASGNQKVLLLFDKSLSSVNQSSGQLTGTSTSTTPTGTGTSTGTGTTSTTTSTLSN